MYKVGVVTVYNINNYGSTLQAYALQKTLESLGFEPYIILPKRSKWERRLGRIRTMFILGLRIIRYPEIFKHFLDFKRSLAVINNKTSETLKAKYKEFIRDHLNILEFSQKSLKKKAKSDSNFAFICGSDQIWRGAMVLINKNSFLRFAPRHKRISFSPSIGGRIEKFNVRIFRKYISEIPYLSIRELHGADEIKTLIGRKAKVTLDPTLLVKNEFWRERALLPETKDDYILCYFLNKPSAIAIKHIAYLASKYNYKVKLIPYENELINYLGAEVCEPGPFGFLGYFQKAKFVCTDSYHGVAFSISYNKNFYVYHREYTHSYKETSRLDSILSLMELHGRLIEDADFDNKEDVINYATVNQKLEERRKISYDFLTGSLYKIGEKNELL